MPYLWGWVVVGCAALLLVIALQRALRGYGPTLLKCLLGWWLLAVVLVPAQVPRHNDALAPALIVFLFESVFQRNGSPAAAGRVLLAASVLGLALGLIWYLALRLRLRRRRGGGENPIAAAAAASVSGPAGVGSPGREQG
jgi:hypothetical protein